MSKPSDTGLDLEALELQLLPAWARQTGEPNRYASFEGASHVASDRPRDHRGPPGRRPERRPARRGPGGGPPSRRDDMRGRGPRQFGGPRPGGGVRDDRPVAAVALPELEVVLMAEPKGVASLARQIRLTGRAYPIFEIAQLILRRPERYQIRFSLIRKPDGQVAQALWLCNLDSTLWLSEQEAVNHVLRHHLDMFYRAERTPTDPPKGTYTFVAQCGLSGTILGPPNFHDYQAKLARLHTARYARMPLAVYKSKVRIVRDEAVVKKWIEDQSFLTEYVCLNVPDALRLPTMAEVEAHFRQVHLPNIINTVEEWTVDGPATQRLPANGLRQLARRVWDEQRRFPLKLVGSLSQQFASHGLQFFKVRKTVTHVSVARPHYLDVEATPVSDGIRRIVDFINAHEGCTRRDLVQALAPAPAVPQSPPQPIAPTPPPDASSTVEAEVQPETIPAAEPPASSPAPSADTHPPQPDSQTDGEPSPASAPAAESQTAGSASDLSQLTPEQTAVTADLHWLIHQGHVIEFATGILETAKKPKPKPAPSPRPAPESKPESSPEAEVVAVPPVEAASLDQPAPETPPEPTPAETPGSETPQDEPCDPPVAGATPTAPDVVEEPVPVDPPRPS